MLHMFHVFGIIMFNHFIFNIEVYSQYFQTYSVLTIIREIDAAVNVKHYGVVMAMHSDSSKKKSCKGGYLDKEYKG